MSRRSQGKKNDLTLNLQRQSKIMISNYTILTVPQWAIFAAIAVMTYSWAERKPIFGMIGSAILSGLGIYAAVAIASGALVPGELLEMTDPITETPVLAPDEIPLEGRFLPFYLMLIFNGILALTALFADIYKKNWAHPLKIASAVLAIIIFFLMMGVLRA